MKLLDAIRKEDMNDKGHCKNCMLCWTEWSYMYEDCDCGCMMQNTPYNDMYGGWFCIAPKFVKKYLKNQYLKRIENEIDDYCRYVESKMESEENV